MKGEEKLIYKSYLRALLRQIMQIKTSIYSDDLDEAKMLIDELIEDTQNNIKD